MVVSVKWFELRGVGRQGFQVAWFCSSRECESRGFVRQGVRVAWFCPSRGSSRVVLFVKGFELRGFVRQGPSKGFESRGFARQGGSSRVVSQDHTTCVLIGQKTTQQQFLKKATPTNVELRGFPGPHNFLD
jgi:hypothetical protein